MSVSKKLRFDVFNRDKFTCVYCGNTSEDAKLEVDHIHPRSKGGTDEIENLVTSCESCNRGKSDTVIGVSAPTEALRLQRLQELREQSEAASVSMELIQAKRLRRDEITEIISDIVSNEYPPPRLVSTVINRIDEFGADLALEWLECAAARTGGDWGAVGRYFSGCARKQREEAYE